MNFAADVLTTIAVLDDSRYLRSAERMARATEGVGAGAGLARLASGMTLAGGVMTALSAKAVGVAASYQQQEQAFEALLGSATRGRAMFQELANFTVHTPFQLQDWTQATRTLLGWGVAADQIMPALKGLGNAEASMGRTGADLQKAAYELGEMNSGFISMRQVRNLMMDGVPAATALRKELHLTGEELANIGKSHIDGKVGVAAILKYVRESNLGGGMQQQMNTLNGSITSLKDNFNLFLSAAGQPALAPLTALVNKASDLLSKFQQMPAAEQKAIGTAALIAGPLVLAAVPLVSLIGLWKDLKTAKNLAKIAQQGEDLAEKGKLGTFTKEATALDTATTKWGGLGKAIKSIPGLLGKIPGAVADALKALSAFGASGTVGSTLVGGAIGAAPFAAAGFGAYKILQQNMARDDAQARGDALADPSPWIAHIAKLRRELRAHPGDPRLTRDLGIEERHLHKILSHPSVRAALAASAPRAAAPAGDGLVADFLKNPGRYTGGGAAKAQRPAAGPRDFAAAALAAAESQMRIARAAHDQAGYNRDRERALTLIDRNVAMMTKYAASIEHVKGKAAEWLAMEKKIDALKERRARLTNALTGDGYAGASGASAKSRAGGAKSGGDPFDRTVAEIINAAGIGEDDLSKMGLNRRLFAEMGKGGIPADRTAQRIRQAVKRPMVVNLNLDGRALQTIRTQITDEVLCDLLSAGETPSHVVPGGGL